MHVHKRFLFLIMNKPERHYLANRRGNLPLSIVEQEKKNYCADPHQYLSIKTRVTACILFLMWDATKGGLRGQCK
jgi:hypothetical protein